MHLHASNSFPDKTERGCGWSMLLTHGTWACRRTDCCVGCKLRVQQQQVLPMQCTIACVQVKMCLVINKIDRLVLETRLTPGEAYERVKAIVAHVNMVVSAFSSEAFISNADAVLAAEDARAAADRSQCVTFPQHTLKPACELSPCECTPGHNSSGLAFAHVCRVDSDELALTESLIDIRSLECTLVWFTHIEDAHQYLQPRMHAARPILTEWN